MNKLSELKKVFEALGNETRLGIVKLIGSKEGVSCQEIMKRFKLSQPSISHHLGLLLDSGVLALRKEGARHFYKVNQQKLKRFGVDVVKF